MDYNFEMETYLKQLNPELHRRFRDAMFPMGNGLSKYKMYFPEFTDHTILHSMNVISFCSRLIGDRLDHLNADEVYILLMACYLHDSGMGIMRKDYEAFSDRIDFGDYFMTHDRTDLSAVIRDFHHEFSAQFIRKYAAIFDIPSPEHEQAIVQVVRGHRITDLTDEREYPADFRVPDGNSVCLPYLAAIVRLADEIDVAADRNPVLLYDISRLTDDRQIRENKKVQAVRRLKITDSDFILEVSTSEEEIRTEIGKLADKMQNTLDYCRAVVSSRTSFTITQEKVRLESVVDPENEMCIMDDN
jgi:hypothetical protein